MNKSKPKLPEDYIPFEELILCSNHLINVKVPIEFENKIPLLIGKGDLPFIWLSAPISKDKKAWKELIVKNKSMDEKISVIPSPENKLITIKVNKLTIIQVIKQSDNKAEVIFLDLRPIGFNVYGDANNLSIVNSSLSANSFQNMWAMIGIG